MKKLIVFTLLLTFVWQWPIKCESQQVPLFEMPLYFEDSVGNRDTVIIGYDESASGSMINTQFGEIQISQPFDSVFDVRLSHEDDGFGPTNATLTKRLISHSEGDCNNIYGAGVFEIVFYAVHPPVTMNWDTSLLDGCGQSGTFITNSYYFHFAMDPYMELDTSDADFICANFVNSYTPQLPVSFSPNSSNWPIEFEYEVEGSGLQMLPTFYWGFVDHPYCEIKYLNIGTINQNRPLAVASFPNPTDDWIYFEIENVEEILTFDSMGRLMTNLMTSHQLGVAAVDVRLFPTGLYYSVIRDENGAFHQSRWLRD